MSFDGVFGGAEKGFDAQMLFDPLEEQLDAPAQAVELGDSERGQEEVENDNRFVGLYLASFYLAATTEIRSSD